MTGKRDRSAQCRRSLRALRHWTRYRSRLDQDFAHPFGSVGYPKEEFRTEIASLMVGDELAEAPRA